MQASLERKKCSFVGLKEHYDQLLSRDGTNEPIGLKGSDLVDCWILADVTYGWLERKFNEAAHVTKKSVIDTYQMAFLGYENLLHKASSIYVLFLAVWEIKRCTRIIL